MAGDDPVAIIEWQPDRSTERLVPLKWNIGNSRYEVHVAVLDGLETGDLLRHCLEVRDRVKKVVSTAAHVAPSLFRVFDRTISLVLQATWDNVLAEVANRDEAAFDEVLKLFIAANCSTGDRYDVVQQIRRPTKPRAQLVQSFFYRLREINSYVSWLPGVEPPLNDAQLKQSLFNGMPQKWRDRFEALGSLIENKTIQELVRYFRQQESNARRKQLENEQAQRKESKSKRRRNANGSPKEKNTDGTKGRIPKKEKKQSKRISDDASCPIHPESKHTWGECFANAFNNKRKNKSKDKEDEKESKKSSKKPKQSFAVESEDSKTIDHILEKELDDDDNGSVLTFDADEPMDSLGTKSDTENDESKSMMTCVAEFSDQSFAVDTHHIDLLSPDTMQPTKSNFREIFMAQALHLYANGLDEVNNDISTGLKSTKLRPVSPVIVRSICGIKSKQPLKALFDPGSDETFIHRRVLPKGATPKVINAKTATINGIGSIKNAVEIDDIILSEFSPTQRFQKPTQVLVFDSESSYDLVIGLDLLVPMGIDVSCATQTIRQSDVIVPFKPKEYLRESLTAEDSIIENHCFHIADRIDNSLERNFHTCFMSNNKIEQSKYDIVPPEDVAMKQKHLNSNQQQDLVNLLRKYQPLFNGNLVRTGKLGAYNGPKVHLELNSSAQPFHSRPYPVPHANRAVFKQELDRLVEIGVLERTGPSEYLSPTFIIPKKDGRVRWVSDFRTLNKMIKRKVYTLPRIHDILRKRSGYKFFTKLDISMQYYTFELDDESKNLCAICTPFGNYRYCRLPMGVKQAPDVAQEIMESLFQHLEDVDVYIDDVGIFSKNWENHMLVLEKVLTILQEANFTMNPLKCEWGVQETDWLGHWLTPTGLKPWRKKIDAILNLQPPANIKQLRSFIGAVTFYRDMFPKRSHILSPLTEQVGKRNLDWTPDCQKAFDAIKAILAKEAFIAYPDHNEPFHVYCDASDYQLGAAIFQNNKPVAYYSRKLNAAQRNYTVGEKEILSIVETLKEYRTMLYGCKELHIYTDHKNLTFKTLNSQRVMRWRLFLEEFHPIFHYIKGDMNTLADALSRLSISQGQNDDITLRNPSDLYEKYIPFQPSEQTELNSFYTMAIDDPSLIDCFVHLPAQHGNNFVLDYGNISDAQDRDAELQNLAINQPAKYVRQLLAPGRQVWCYIAQPNVPWKIYLPNELLEPAIRWYHHALSHCGSTRLWQTMSMHLYNAKLKNRIEDIVRACDTCQRYKNNTRTYGFAPAREAELLPWSNIAVDLIGPWTLKIDDQNIKFTALTIIDTVTNLVEIVRLENKSSAHVALQFENNWLARYPLPSHITYDQGTKFTGAEFQNCLFKHNIIFHLRRLIGWTKFSDVITI